MKKRLAAALSVIALGVGAAGVPAASAVGPGSGNTAVGQVGLVNVNVVALNGSEILSRNNVGVGVAANVAANVCGLDVTVAVLAADITTGGFEPTTCTIGDQTGTLTIEQSQ